MPGMATPGEVTDARREESPSIDEDSTLNSRLQQVGPNVDDPGRDDRGIDRD
jgi:hypothetical protein